MIWQILYSLISYEGTKEEKNLDEIISIVS
jgi:hypothetical protein